MTSRCLISLAVMAISLSTVTCSQGQEPRSANTLGAGSEFQSPPAKIEDLAWIAGHWQGEAMGGAFEETWNPPMGGAMMGMFKFVSDDQIGFYELLTIVPAADSLVLRLKHFNDQLHGWEDKQETVDFALVKMTENEACFDGLTFRRIGPSELHIFVVAGEQADKAEELQFVGRRVNQVPSSESRSTDQPSAARRAMMQVMEIDRVLAAQRDEMPESLPVADAVASYVSGLAAINFDECPDDFTDAYRRHRQAWEESIPFLKEHPQLRGEMHGLFDEIRQMDKSISEQLDRHLQAIGESWSDVETAMSRFP